MTQEALRPMSISQVLDRTFYLYRANFVLFAGIALVGPALSLIASFIQLGTFGMPVMPTPGQFDLALFQKLIVQSIVGAILGLIFYTIGQALATGATVHAVSMVHLGKQASISDSYRAIQPIFWRILRILVTIYFLAFWPVVLGYLLFFALFGVLVGMGRSGGSPTTVAVVALGTSLLVFVGVMGGLVWSVYVYCRYSLAIPACTVEKLGARDSMARSRFLAKDGLGRIVVVYLLTAVMTFALTSVFQIPAFFSTNIFSMKPGAQITTGFLFWSTLGGFLGRTLAGPIATIAIALIYYDQRVRKEAFDLQLMMEAIGQPATPPPPPLANPASPGLG